VLLNSDSDHYGGANLGTAGAEAVPEPLHGLPCSITLDLPPLAGMVLVRRSS
jgi:1,4-alpha-glucan branching enzyme